MKNKVEQIKKDPEEVRKRASSINKAESHKRALVNPTPIQKAARIMDKYTDHDPFPFGTHQGKKFEDIDDAYFRWFLDQVPAKERAMVYNYAHERIHGK